MYFKIFKLAEAPLEKLKELKKFTKRGKSLMRDALNSAMLDERDKYNTSTGIVAIHKNKILGWALVQDDFIFNYKKLMVGVYIIPPKRRKGIGRKLIVQAKIIAHKKRKKLQAYPWNGAGISFFDSVKINW